jgi:hypothetical protein
VLAVSVFPTIGTPLIAGGAVFTGDKAGGVGITDVAADDADADPPAFVAVTIERIVWPTSVAASV